MTWSLGGLTYDSKSVRPSGTPLTGGSLNGIFVGKSGTKLYALNGVTQLDEYTLSTAYDISTATFVNTYNPALVTANHPSTIVFNCAGTKFWVNDNTSGTGENLIKEYTLSTAWDITTASLTNTKDLSAASGTFAGYAWSWANDGAKFYVYGTFPNIYEYDASTAYDITTLTYASKSFAINTVTGITYGTIFRVTNDGTKLITAQFNTPNRLMYELSLGTAYDISTINTTPVDTYNLTSDESFITNSDLFCYDECATKLFHVGEGSGSNNTPFIYQWDASTAVATEPCCGTSSSCPSVTYFQGGVARLTTGTVTGLWWLGCDTIKALVDGIVTDLVVCNGKITFPRTAARAHIGLAYTADIETLNAIGAQGSSEVQGGRKRITDVTTRFYKSRLPLVGPSFDDMVQMKQRDTEAYGEPTGLLSGDHVQNIPGEWNTHGRVAYRQTEPVPLTILGIFPEVEVEDDG